MFLIEYAALLGVRFKCVKCTTLYCKPVFHQLRRVGFGNYLLFRYVRHFSNIDLGWYVWFPLLL